MKTVSKVLVVAPGAVYSTYDMFKYYLDAFRSSGLLDKVDAFNYHNMLVYHQFGSKGMADLIGGDVASGDEIVHRASRDLVTEVLTLDPDVVLFIAGTGIPVGVYSWISRLRKETHRNFLTSVYITEAPYIDDMNERIMKFCDVVFMNDKKSVQRLNPDGSKFIHYLPHSYSGKVHYPGVADKNHTQDVFFCGTMFEERAKVFSGVDWSGIDLRLMGWWSLTKDAEKEVLSPYMTESVVLNSEVAEYYRGSKIGLNYHRTSSYFGEGGDGGTDHIDGSEAYSVGPRVIEAAACGAFQLSDYREELVDLFGDSIPVYSDSIELEAMIKKYLAPGMEERRRSMADAAMLSVSERTYENRVKDVVQILNEAYLVRHDLMGDINNE